MKYVRALKKVTVEFCGKTSIHGLKYIIQPGRSLGERIFWVIMALISLAIAVGFIAIFYVEWRSKPTRESIMSHTYPTWMIPFPAITLCNSNRISRSRAINFIKSLTYPPDIKFEDLLEETKMLLYIMGYNSMVNISNKSTNNQKRTLTMDNLYRIQNILDLNNKSYEETMYKLGQPCSEMITNCAVKGQFADCLQLFEPSKTFYGFCCSFNYRMPTPDITTFTQGKQLKNKDVEKIGSFSYGSDWGVSIVLNPGASDYFASMFASEGISVIIHFTSNYPSEMELKSTVPLGGEAFLRLTPASRYVSTNLRSLTPLQRHCFFDDEIKLKYFSNYSFENCLLESKVDYILKTCQCLPFTYPRVAGFKTCSLKAYRCLKQYFDVWTHWSKDNITVDIGSKAITCLEECHSYQYEISTSVGGLEAVHHNSLSANVELNVSQLAVVHVYVDSHISMRLFRQRSFTFNHQLSTIGGIFGIAFGCSMISLVEMLYFFTIRFLHYVRSETLAKVKTVHVIPYRN